MSRIKKPFWLVGVLASLALVPAPARAAADVELDRPYKIRIVVSMDRHRLLTDIFRRQVTRELRDGLKAAMGELASVEVVGRHPLLDAIQKRGLGKALDGYRERSEFLTHFVVIDFSGSHYHVQTRLHDGLSGLPAPAVHQERTRDRAYVARVATLLLERDLGLCGTVESEPGRDQKVEVRLKGGKLGVDLGKWIKKGEVFGLVRVETSGPGQRVPWTVLQVVEPPSRGVCVCRLFSRYALRKVSGLRAVLLGTRTGPLRLRLMQDRPGAEPVRLITPVTLQIRQRGFEGEEATMLTLTPGSGRDVDTSGRGEKGQFSRLAFLTVLAGGEARAKVPVPILDDSLQVVVLPAGTDEDDRVAVRYRQLRSNVLDAYLVQSGRFREINELTAKAEDRGKALTSVKETIRRSQKDHQQFSADRDELEAEIKKLPAREQERFSLKGIDDVLERLKEGEAELLKHVALLEKIEREENDPKRKEWRVLEQSARVLEKEGELGEALAIYKKAPEEFRTAELKAHIEELEKRWKPVDDEHAKARAFLYESFPKLTTAELKDRIDEARKAFEVCRKANDRAGPTRLLRALTAHVKRIEKELDELKPDVNVDDEKPAQVIKELLPKIRDLYRDVEAWLEKK